MVNAATKTGSGKAAKKYGSENYLVSYDSYDSYVISVRQRNAVPTLKYLDMSGSTRINRTRRPGCRWMCSRRVRHQKI